MQPVRLIYIREIRGIMYKIHKEQSFLGIGIAIMIIYLLNLFVLAALSPG
jgi:hypothetical protein